jgi:hypothetical protein
MSVTESRTPFNSSLRWNAIQRIARQQARDSLLGWSLYLAAAIAVLIAVILVYNSIRFVGESGLNIVLRPFFLPLQAALSLALLYITAEAALAIARPREQGALQVLFFAPIDIPVLVGGFFLAGLLVYVLFLLLIVPVLLILAWITNFVVPTGLLWGLVPTIFIAGVTIAFGLFISAAAPSARSAVLLLVAAILILLVIQGAYAALLSIPPTNRFYDALLFLRVFLGSIQGLLSWVSPFRMLDIVLAAALRGDWLNVLQHVGIAIIGTLFWLAASVWAMRQRGVLP